MEIVRVTNGGFPLTYFLNGTQLLYEDKIYSKGLSYKYSPGIASHVYLTPEIRRKHVIKITVFKLAQPYLSHTCSISLPEVNIRSDIYCSTINHHPPQRNQHLRILERFKHNPWCVSILYHREVEDL